MARPRTAGGAGARCPRCGARTLTQWVGRHAALQPTVDLTPIDPALEDQLREPNRLIWCLITGPWRTPEIRWRCHSRACTHDVVIQHRCGPTEPTTLF